ncbi:MAG TPA: nascent polypeptide-associated complex protein [Thermoproteales archaeon]|nr:nascent polypeptide-associated complex protein [Thermoproteales archaeon]
MRRLSPREIRRLSKRLGIEFQEVPGVIEVRIVFPDKVLVIEDPKVSIISMGGENIYQVMGTPREVTVEEEEEVEINEEDIELVALQAGVSREEAARALKETKGDLAKAILLLKSR